MNENLVAELVSEAFNVQSVIQKGYTKSRCGPVKKLERKADVMVRTPVSRAGKLGLYERDNLGSFNGKAVLESGLLAYAGGAPGGEAGGESEGTDTGAT